jgi:teichuronic acid biosynthesis glycosyltransferase TuaH
MSCRSRAAAHFDLVVCSLEPWNEIWRRNQFLVAELLCRDPLMRVLFVEPPADALFDLYRRRRPTPPRLRRMDPDGRLRAFRPLKPLPRRLGGNADRAVLWQVLVAARLTRFRRPLLWINDVTYAPLITRTRWPSLYDVTDDWLLAAFPPRELERLRALDALALDSADEVVVCSPALAASRGAQRPVSLIPNAVDVGHFRRGRPRPVDLPEPPVAVYIGSLHEARLDVDLVVELASSLPKLNIALVGPDSLDGGAKEALRRAGVNAIGPRPYDDVPAYLQHADVVIVPHIISPFTDSLDPIKAYECLVVGTPTVATPVAGFRELGNAMTVVGRKAFVAAVSDVLEAPPRAPSIEPPTWTDRADAFAAILARARSIRERRDT